MEKNLKSTIFNIPTFIIVLVIISFTILQAQNQDITLKGKVLNGQTNEPLPFANIYLKDTNIGTSTDIDGNFHLTLPYRNGQLLISFLGFKTEIIEVKKLNPLKKINVYLYPQDVYLQQVSVYASVKNKQDEIKVSALSLQSDKIKKISTAMPDVLRALQFLPGIAANNEYSAEFNVRGGNKDENLVLVNGAEVYEPFHIKEASNASVGIFNVDLINNVDLITGGFSARYGDRLSSVVNIEYRNGNRKEYKGAGTISLAYADGYVEGPISKKSSFIFGVRKTYLEYLIGMLNFDYEDIDRAKPSFYDAQGVLSYDFSPTNKLKFEFIHSGDDFRYNPTSANSFLNYQGDFNGQQAFFRDKIETYQDNIGKYNSTLLDLQSIIFLSKNAFIKSNLSYYDQRDNEYRIWKRSSSKDISADHIYFDRRSGTRENRAVLNIKTLEAKTALDYQFSPFYETKSGISFKNIVYLQNFTDNHIIDNFNNIKHYPDTTYYSDTTKGVSFANELLNAKSYKLSGYLENIFQIKNNFLVNVGGRFDYFDINRNLNFSPRISMAYFSKFGSVIRAAWGEYYQSPIYRQLAYSVASDTNTQAQHATHYILGLEQNFSLSNSKLSVLKIKLDLYYKNYNNLISSYFATFDRLAYSRHNDSKGYAKGFDLYILLSLPDFYTWISYGFLDAKENNLTDNLIGYYPRYTDQKHTLTWVADLTLGKGWGVNTRIAYGSGFPYTPRESYFDEKRDQYVWKKKPINSAYLPDYKRVDLRISKYFKFQHFVLKTFIDISNITNFQNIQGFEYKFDSVGKPIIKKVYLWPILPSFGIRFQF